MLPDGWKEKIFGDIVRNTQLGTTKRGADINLDHNLNLVKMGNLLWGSLDLSNVEKLSSNQLDGDYLLKKGDFLFNTRNTPELVGKSAAWKENSGSYCYDNNINRITFSNDADPFYMEYYLNFGSGKKSVRALASGSTSVAAIYWKGLKNLRIILPPLPEQKKIAAILSTWDRAIEGTEKLLANSQQQKKALMQQLLTGKKRLPGFTGEWKNYTLENILNVRKEKSLPSNKIPLFSLTIEGGITSKTDRYNREFLVKNKNEKKYKVVYPRDLVYNPANLRWGAINYSRIPHKVVVSPIYEVLYVNNIERFFPDLIYQYLMSPFQIEKFSSMIEGTLMERKAVKISPFLATKIRIPSEFPEQQAIAAVLSTADEEITAIESNLSRLRQEKKALMQQLLTGKRRVKVD